MTHRVNNTWPLALIVLLASAHYVRGQEAAPQAPARVRWEYKAAEWTEEDTTLTLRAASGDEVGEREDMLRILGEEITPRDNPALQRAIDARIGLRLSALGAEGWELVWMREGTTVSDGHVLPAPTLILKRRAR